MRGAGDAQLLILLGGAGVVHLGSTYNTYEVRSTARGGCVLVRECRSSPVHHRVGVFSRSFRSKPGDAEIHAVVGDATLVTCGDCLVRAGGENGAPGPKRPG